MENSAGVNNDIAVEGSSNDERPDPIVEDLEEDKSQEVEAPVTKTYDNSNF